MAYYHFNNDSERAVTGESIGDITGVLPANGATRFVLDELPSKGIVVLEPSTGEFVYRPNDATVDTMDSFSYYIINYERNYSMSRSVKVTAKAVS